MAGTQSKTARYTMKEKNVTHRQEEKKKSLSTDPEMTELME